jgi:hypothetical protein
LKNTLKVLNELKEKGLIKDYAFGGSDSGFEMDRAFFLLNFWIFLSFWRKKRMKKD